jgi:hypothetical protein
MIVKQNIPNGLDISTRLFDAMTNDKCAACVKIIDIADENDGSGFDDLLIKILMRDSRSRPKRNSFDHDHWVSLRENDTALRHIFETNDGFFTNRIFVLDNLKLASERGQYCKLSDRVGRGL